MLLTRPRRIRARSAAASPLLGSSWRPTSSTRCTSPLRRSSSVAASGSGPPATTCSTGSTSSSCRAPAAGHTFCSGPCRAPAPKNPVRLAELEPVLQSAQRGGGAPWTARVVRSSSARCSCAKREVPSAVVDVLFGCPGLVVDRLLQPAPARGQSNDPGATVARVGPAGEVAVLFKVAQQVVDGLPGDLEALGELGRALPVEPRVAEQRDMGGVHVVNSGCDHARVDLLPYPLPDHPHHGAHMRAVLPGSA